MSGNTISYNEYEGMLDDNEIMELSTVFYIECGQKNIKLNMNYY